MVAKESDLMRNRIFRMVGACLLAVLGAQGINGTPLAPQGQTCQGEVTIGMVGNPAMPTGPATNHCLNPCIPGCQSFIVVLVGAGGGVQQAAACGCAGAGANPCCQAILTPPNSTGGPVPGGKCGIVGCPPGNQCRVLAGVGRGIAGPAEMGAQGKCFRNGVQVGDDEIVGYDGDDDERP